MCIQEYIYYESSLLPSDNSWASSSPPSTSMKSSVQCHIQTFLSAVIYKVCNGAWFFFSTTPIVAPPESPSQARTYSTNLAQHAWTAILEHGTDVDDCHHNSFVILGSFHCHLVELPLLPYTLSRIADYIRMTLSFPRV